MRKNDRKGAEKEKHFPGSRHDARHLPSSVSKPLGDFRKEI